MFYDNRDILQKFDAVTIAVPAGQFNIEAKYFLAAGADVLIDKLSAPYRKKQTN
jgi:hypothetical protein